MNPPIKRPPSLLLAALTSYAFCSLAAAQTTTPFSFTEHQTVDINGIFPADQSNNIAVFSTDADGGGTLGNPYTTTVYSRAASNNGASFQGRRVQLYLQFDTTGLTAETISSATLEFDAFSLNNLANAVNNPNIVISQLTNDWDPAGGGALDPVFDPAVTTTVIDNVSDTSVGNIVTSYSIEVASIVQNWQSGEVNNGFLLEMGDSVSFNQGLGIDIATLALNVTQVPNPTATLSTANAIVTDPYTINVNFSEDVTGLTDSDFTVVNGTASSLSGSGAAYTVLITPTAAGDVEVTLPLDAANATAGGLGNVSSSTLVTNFDPPMAPSVVLATSSALFDQFIVSAVFDEDVSGLDLSDFVVTNGTANNLAGTGSAYTIEVTATAPGDIDVSLPASSATDLDDGLDNLASNTLTVTFDPAASALSNFLNADLNTPVPTIGNTGSGAFAWSFDPADNSVLFNGVPSAAGANEWVLASLSRGWTYDADSGAGGIGDGAFIENTNLFAGPRAVLYFANDNAQTTGPVDFGIDVFLDDNTVDNALQFLVEVYAWNDGQTAPQLSAGGPGENDPTYNTTLLGDAVTILNTQVLATNVTDATWLTVPLGTADLSTGFDNYAWRVGVLGATEGDLFAFDNITVTPGTAIVGIENLCITRAANGDVTLDFTSSGNVDVYRSIDLIDFGSTPIGSNVASGSYLDTTAASLPEAFYLLLPTGSPAP